MASAPRIAGLDSGGEQVVDFARRHDNERRGPGHRWLSAPSGVAHRRVHPQVAILSRTTVIRTPSPAPGNPKRLVQHHRWTLELTQHGVSRASLSRRWDESRRGFVRRWGPARGSDSVGPSLPQTMPMMVEGGAYFVALAGLGQTADQRLDERALDPDRCRAAPGSHRRRSAGTDRAPGSRSWSRCAPCWRGPPSHRCTRRASGATALSAGHDAGLPCAPGA